MSNLRTSEAIAAALCNQREKVSIHVCRIYTIVYIHRNSAFSYLELKLVMILSPLWRIIKHITF